MGLANNPLKGEIMLDLDAITQKIGNLRAQNTDPGTRDRINALIAELQSDRDAEHAPEPAPATPEPVFPGWPADFTAAPIPPIPAAADGVGELLVNGQSIPATSTPDPLPVVEEPVAANPVPEEAAPAPEPVADLVSSLQASHDAAKLDDPTPV